MEMKDLYLDDRDNIPVCDVSAGETLFTFRGDPHHFMSLLLANMPFEPRPPSDSDIVSVSSDRMKRTTKGCSPNRTITDELCREHIDYKSSCSSAMFREKRQKTSLPSSESQSNKISKCLLEENDLKMPVMGEHSDSVTMGKYVIFVTGQHTVIAIHEIRDDLHCDKDQNAVSEVPGQHIDVPDYILNFKDIYVIGLCLSKDHR